MAETALHEWLQPQWQQLLRAIRQGRLPHALLFAGPEGIGKRRLADELAAALLCETPDGRGHACGHCTACGWLKAGSHPDLLDLQPEESGKAIKVDQVRQVCTELAMTSHGGRYKVAIVHPAEAMNVNAANSLLKTLEEPTANTLLLLLSAAPGRLPATIRSRCQQLRFPLPATAAAVDWLQRQGVEPERARHCLHHAGEAPLAALRLAQEDADDYEAQLGQLQQLFAGRLDPLELAREWAAGDEVPYLQRWSAWIGDLVRWRQAGRRPPDEAVVRMLQQIAETVDCRQLFLVSDRIGDALNSIGSGLNRQLLLEDLLISWARMARRGDGSTRQVAGKQA
ncbi:MAG TPA: DNA polymerase III subunit delta' [Gammaproteobacteria bacterium]|nr:DNA polymerase III subunit delta' [Gammaproteobacteria bacterium]